MQRRDPVNRPTDPTAVGGLPARVYAWAVAIAAVTERTPVALAPVFGVDPDNLVDRGYDVEAATPPAGVRHLVFVPDRSSPDIVAIRLYVDIDIDELPELFGPPQKLVPPPHGSAMLVFNSVPGLTVVAHYQLHRAHLLDFELDE